MKLILLLLLGQTIDFHLWDDTPTVVKPTVKISYPVHAQRRPVDIPVYRENTIIRWTPNWNPSKEQIIWHLNNVKPNHGHFDKYDLTQLSRSELLSLHDDDHDGKVRWSYLPVHMPLKVPKTIK